MADTKSTFSEEEFLAICRELEHPNVEGFEYFTQSHGVTIYRRYHEDSGLYEYKIYGVLDDVSPEMCAEVYMDLEYRKQWDSYVNELYETEDNGKNIIYWHINFIWPMSNRDYVYSRHLKEITLNDKKMWAVLARSEKENSIPEKDGVIRVEDYEQSCALTTDGKVGTKAYMHYYDNPKGSIPTWLINWGAKTGVPGFLTMMQDACRKYPDYLKSKQQVQTS